MRGTWGHNQRPVGRSLRRLAAAGACLLALAGVAACGGDDEDGAAVGGGDDGGGGGGAELITYEGEDRQQKLLECARKEGKVVFWTSFSAFPEYYEPAFEKAYPDIDVEVLLDPNELASKVQATEGAGQHEMDLISDTRGKIPRDDRYFTPIWTPRIDELQANVTTEYSIPFTGYVLGLGYNTEMTPPGEGPKTWQDLVKPEYEGKVFMGTGISPIIIAGLLNELYGEEFLDEFASKVKVQQTSIRAIADQVNAGTNPFGLPIAAHFYKTDAITNKAPLGFRALNPSFSSFSDVSISKNAPHPCAAALMLDWLLADDGGQKINRDTGATSPIEGTDPVPFEVEGEPPPAEWDVIPATDPKLVDKYGGYEQALEAWSDLFNEKFLSG